MKDNELRINIILGAFGYKEHKKMRLLDKLADHLKYIDSHYLDVFRLREIQRL